MFSYFSIRRCEESQWDASSLVDKFSINLSCIEDEKPIVSTIHRLYILILTHLNRCKLLLELQKIDDLSTKKHYSLFHLIKSNFVVYDSTVIGGDSMR